MIFDWSKRLLHIRRAFTRDENGKVMLGKTKNKYSRRTIKLIPVMYDALKAQKKIYDQFKGEYFFCSTTGKRVDRSHLRQKVWTPALKKAGVKYREIKQTRGHTGHSCRTCFISARTYYVLIAASPAGRQGTGPG